MPTSPQTDGECQGAGELASFNTAADVDRDMLEWNYGQYEGLRTAEIHAEPLAWQLFRDAVFRLRQVSESRMLPRQAPSRFAVLRQLARRTRSRKGGLGRVESQYLVGASSSGHSIKNHSSTRTSLRFSSRCAGRTRRAAKRELSLWRVPARQDTCFQAGAGRAKARSFTDTGGVPRVSPQARGRTSPSWPRCPSGKRLLPWFPHRHRAHHSHHV